MLVVRRPFYHSTFNFGGNLWTLCLYTYRYVTMHTGLQGRAQFNCKKLADYQKGEGTHSKNGTHTKRQQDTVRHCVLCDAIGKNPSKF